MRGGHETPHLLTWLATLNDLARLRILRLIAREELSVGELANALQLPQSTVSRHLKVLHDAGWSAKRAEGTASLFSLSASALGKQAEELWSISMSQLQDDSAAASLLQADDDRLAEVLAERRTDSKAFFGRIAGEWDELRNNLFGGQFTAHALLGLVPANWVVADIGAGTGNAAELIAPFVKKVIAVDREPTMLQAARKRLAGISNIEFRQGEIDKLPIRADEVDAALLFLLLHHLPDPADAVRNLANVIRPHGILMIVDMLKHDREVYRRSMGHIHLGFDESQLAAWARSAKLTDFHFRRLRPDISGKGPGLFVATMRKPG
ncbi:MAG TPA: metalloregulator ArsR/SmtB family transcription factor [Phycisphaerales bacterium]|nr:metalloregulator ArsR/SmtB family transcription factor [Phycisphaerales bacterium]